MKTRCKVQISQKVIFLQEYKLEKEPLHGTKSTCFRILSNGELPLVCLRWDLHKFVCEGPLRSASVGCIKGYFNKKVWAQSSIKVDMIYFLLSISFKGGSVNEKFEGPDFIFFENTCYHFSS